MNACLRRGGVVLGLVLSIGLGWAGYQFGEHAVWIVLPDLTALDAKRLAVILFGLTGLIVGAANEPHASRRH